MGCLPFGMASWQVRTVSFTEAMSKSRCLESMKFHLRPSFSVKLAVSFREGIVPIL